MDVRLAVASRREVRKYAPEPLPDDVVVRIQLVQVLAHRLAQGGHVGELQGAVAV